MSKGMTSLSYHTIDDMGLAPDNEETVEKQVIRALRIRPEDEE